MPEILLRTFVALGILFIGFALYLAWNRFQMARLRQPLKGLEDFRPGSPAILYFTTPDCQPCKTLQRPALEKLSNDWRVQVQIIEADATLRPDLADYWGVLSVPTTFVIDSKGQPRGINHGVATAEKLLKQLEATEGMPILSHATCGRTKEQVESLKLKVEP